MAKLTRTQAIQNFLNNETWPDLAALYDYGMEVQVLVAQDQGERETGEWKGHRYEAFRDPLTGETWKDFRIPHNGDKDPSYDDDPPMSYDLAKHADGVGLSGWDWLNRVTRYVAFDFDSMKEHAKGLSAETLHEVQARVEGNQYVGVRRSTRGSGLHLYVAFETPVPTKNRIEHRAVARAVLSQLSAAAGYNFESAVDKLGGNMWVWHRKMAASNKEGLKLIKVGVPLPEAPKFWRDHVDVCAGHTKKSRPFFLKESDKPNESEKLFEELLGRRSSVPIDEGHQLLIDWLQGRNFSGQWYSDRNMLVTHTVLLKEAHRELGLKGIFETASTGKDYGRDINCFAFPLPKGAWVVRRYSPGTPEHDSWEQDNQGYTRSFLNRQPDLVASARTYGGQERTAGGYVFTDAHKAEQAIKALGGDLTFPKSATHREIVLKKHTKDNRLVVTIKKEDSDDRKDAEFKTWTPERGVYSKILNLDVAKPSEVQSDNYDSFIRHLVTEGNENFGWAINVNDRWNFEPLDHIKKALIAQGLKSAEADVALGSIVTRPFTMVNEPFQPEWPSDGRNWNCFGAQLKFTPSKEEKLLQYPTYTKILQHCGKSLDEAVRNNAWCMLHGIDSGSKYLMAWIACALTRPKVHLPYLFFFGPQNSGKSSFHEMLTSLLLKGFCRGDKALISQGGFNAELQYALFCIIEETDLRRNKVAADRIKDWVTAQEISVHAKGKTPYNAKNYTKWIQCSNDSQACPVFPGDTRVTMIFVDNLEPAELIPKERLKVQLDKEAPDFLAAVEKFKLPEPDGRLGVGVLETSSKEQLQEKNLDPVEMFLNQVCFHVPGELILYADLYQRFVEWLEPNERPSWSKLKFGRELPDRHPKGRLRSNPNYHVGNLSFSSGAANQAKLRLVNGVLVT